MKTIIALTFLLASTIWSGEVRLRWDANPEPGVTYIVYWWRPGDSQMESTTTKETRITITGLPTRTRLIFAVQAELDGLRSPLSESVTGYADREPPKKVPTAVKPSTKPATAPKT